jgi:hypothetical protein
MRQHAGARLVFERVEFHELTGSRDIGIGARLPRLTVEETAALPLAQLVAHASSQKLEQPELWSARRLKRADLVLVKDRSADGLVVAYKLSRDDPQAAVLWAYWPLY